MCRCTRGAMSSRCRNQSKAPWRARCFVSVTRLTRLSVLLAPLVLGVYPRWNECWRSLLTQSTRREMNETSLCSSCSVASSRLVKRALNTELSPVSTSWVDGPSWRVTGFHYPSTRAVNSASGNRTLYVNQTSKQLQSPSSLQKTLPTLRRVTTQF